MDSPVIAVVPGLILPDGTLQLTGACSMPPGPVEVVLRSIATGSPSLPARTVRVPDYIDDPYIVAPFDLPRTGPMQRIVPKVMDSYPLPEPHDLEEFQ